MTGMPGTCRRCRAPVWWNGLYWAEGSRIFRQRDGGIRHVCRKAKAA